VPAARALAYLNVATDALFWLLIVKHGLLHWMRSEPFSLTKSRRTGHVSCRHDQEPLSSYGAVSIPSRNVTIYQLTRSHQTQSLSSFFTDKVATVHQATYTYPPAVFTGPCPNQLNDFILCTIDDICRVTFQSAGKSCDLTRYLTHFLCHHLMTYYK
jgi:hypothetical protein